MQVRIIVYNPGLANALDLAFIALNFIPYTLR